MNRSDLIDELAAGFVNLTKNDAEFAVKIVLDALQDAMVAGHHIEIRGFGSFSIAHLAARVGRNPRSGESVAVPEKRTIHFKTGKALREAVGTRHVPALRDNARVTAEELRMLLMPAPSLQNVYVTKVNQARS